MLCFYHISIWVFEKILWISALVNHKAYLLVKGRKMQQNLWSNVEPITKKTIWFHFASLGEFEQGRPILEKIKEEHSEEFIVITFFSPSGFEIKKNTPLADLVFYLPADTKANAQAFIHFINPKMAFFVKYEYWYHFFHQLKQKNIPLYIVAAIFRPNQIFFKWYGSLHRRMLKCVNHFFVQNTVSKTLLTNLGFNNISITGDTRFDRVYQQAQKATTFPLILSFKKGHNIFIAGSSWDKDEKLLFSLIKQKPEWKFIIAPHDIDSGKIKHLTKHFNEKAILFSELVTLPLSTIENANVLIIDQIGHLSSIYQYGDIAYIGGGFNKGIHNCLEAATFGLPIVFGPRYHKFQEAHELITIGGAVSISNKTELQKAFNKFADNKIRLELTKTIKKYINDHIGATAKIINAINNQL